MEHKKGNYFKRTFGPFYDEAGALYTFPTTNDIVFAIKTIESDEDADAAVLANFASGVTLTASAGTFQVIVASSGMDIDAATYYMGAQEERTDGNSYELDLTENDKSINTITITDDIVRGS